MFPLFLTIFSKTFLPYFDQLYPIFLPYFPDMELSPQAQSIISECQQQVTAALRLLLSHCHDNDDVMFYRCHSAVVDMQSVSSIMEPERRDMFAVCSMEYPTYEKLKSKEDF